MTVTEASRSRDRSRGKGRPRVDERASGVSDDNIGTIVTEKSIQASLCERVCA